jgi:hypothetical protein
MRCVYEAENLVDAQLVRDALEAGGIPAFVSGAHLAGAVGELPALGLMRVLVPEVCVADAAVVVAQAEALLGESRGALDQASGNGPVPAT